ncbi:CCA tRNA nucleotidyltransferase [Roseixanthobacter glucoisosaccharinicivorans]|uniref:CCA tRNA nucleotidyltransferase n=1 Tax=Roseixanthobacter glucoisosaccharinicivorans TaxID=3119923 RepID=UPI003728CFC7
MSAASLADAPWFTAAPLRRVLGVLDGAGEETRVVGGAVRNALLGRPVSEVDLATTAVPEETMRRARAAGLKAVPTGLAHGTVTVVADGTPFEVTTLREDIETDGRHAVVRFGRDWRADAARRDFTMNALYADAQGRVIDLVGGLGDLRAGRVRFIGDAQTRIREDHLRIMRLFRFHAAYGRGPMDEAALSAAIRLRAGILLLSRERVGSELLKLLVVQGAAPTVRLMGETGFLPTILGGVPDLISFERLASLDVALDLTPEAVRRLGVLAVRIVEDAARLRERLRLSNEAFKRLQGMAGATGAAMDARQARASIYRLGRAMFEDRLLVGAARGGRGNDEVAALLDLARVWTVPAPPFRAADLIAQGLKPGPALGAALARMEDAWIAADFATDAQSLHALMALARP